MNRWTLASMLLLLASVSLPVGADGDTANGRGPAAGEWTYSPKLLWEVKAPGGDTLQIPAEVRITGDGRVVFRDFGRNVSYILDKRGRLITTFALAGDEPGEVSRYLNCFTSEGEIAIASPSALHVFTNEGEFLRSRANNVFERFPLAFVGPDRFLCAPGQLSSDAESRAEIYEVDLSTGEGRLFAAINPGGEPPQAAGGPALLIRGLTPTMELGRDARAGRVYFGRSDVYNIHVVTAGGEAVRSIKMQRDRIAIDEAGKRAHFAGMSIPEERLAPLVKSLPSELTHFRRLQVIGDLLYVTATGTIDRAPREVVHDIFTLEGDYLYRGRITVPGPANIAGSEDNLVLCDGFFVVVLAYPDGGRGVACYAVKMPPLD